MVITTYPVKTAQIRLAVSVAVANTRLMILAINAVIIRDGWTQVMMAVSGTLRISQIAETMA